MTKTKSPIKVTQINKAVRAVAEAALKEGVRTPVAHSVRTYVHFGKTRVEATDGRIILHTKRIRIQEEDLPSDLDSHKRETAETTLVPNSVIRDSWKKVLQKGKLSMFCNAYLFKNEVASTDSETTSCEAFSSEERTFPRTENVMVDYSKDEGITHIGLGVPVLEKLLKAAKRLEACHIELWIKDHSSPIQIKMHDARAELEIDGVFMPFKV